MRRSSSTLLTGRAVGGQNDVAGSNAGIAAGPLNFRRESALRVDLFTFFRSERPHRDAQFCVCVGTASMRDLLGVQLPA